MSIISQIGVVILIAFIVLVLIRSNKNLKKASEEGENFVDEWALRQEKKEEIKQKREEKKLEVQKEKEQKKLQKKQKRKGILVDEDNEPEEYELREEKEEKQALEEEQYAEEYPKKNDFSEMEYEEESQQDGYDGESIRVNTDWLYDYEEQERKRRSELKKVVWPDRKTVMKNTGTVLLCSLLIGACIWIFDFVMVTAVQMILSLFA